MSTQAGPGSPGRSMTTEGDPNNFEEPEDYALRKQLSLRPIYYSTNSDRTKGGHPDQRGCPSWCWVAQQDEYDHEVDHTQPMTATHSTDSISVVASCYAGDYGHGEGAAAVHTATLEPRLEQVGQGSAIVRVALRRWRGKDQLFTDSHLRLTVADARELVVALNHLIGLAKD